MDIIKIYTNVIFCENVLLKCAKLLLYLDSCFLNKTLKKSNKCL